MIRDRSFELPNWCSGYHVSLIRRRSPVRNWHLALFYFKDIYFAERPASERLLTKKLDLRGVNKMTDWKKALSEYIESYYQGYLD